MLNCNFTWCAAWGETWFLTVAWYTGPL